MTDFFKGGGKHRGSSLKIEVNKPASWSAQDHRTWPVIQSGPAASLSLVLSEPHPPTTRWLHHHCCSVCCFLIRWSAQSHCRHCIQSGRRRCLTCWPATDLLSPLRRIYFQRNRWSSVPDTCVESHWAENDTSILSLYRSLVALTACCRA